MKVKGTHCALILLGKVQIGNTYNVQRELLIEELHLWGITVDAKEK